MARTWTLVATEALAANDELTDRTRAVTNADKSKVFFNAGLATSNYWKVYQWDGATLTDIAGSSFSGTASSLILRDICVFDDELYALVDIFDSVPASFEASVYKYSGAGTVWTLDEVLLDGADPVAAGFDSTGEDRVFPMDCDGTRLVVAGRNINIALATAKRLLIRDTGGTWSVQTMPTGNAYQPAFFAVGNSKYSDYSELIAVNEPASSAFRAISYGSPNWANLSASNTGDVRLIGYADGLSFWAFNDGGTWKIGYSSDWGVTVSDGGVSQALAAKKARWGFKRAAADAVMLAMWTRQAYTWNSTTAQFDTDGDTGSDDYQIIDFFVLGTTLYALARNFADADSVLFFSGGSIIPNARFYQGAGVLAEKFTLPFAGVNPGGLTLDRALGTVVLGSAAPSNEPVISSVYPYATGTASYTSFPTGTSIQAMEWV